MPLVSYFLQLAVTPWGHGQSNELRSKKREQVIICSKGRSGSAPPDRWLLKGWNCFTSFQPLTDTGTVPEISLV